MPSWCIRTMRVVATVERRSHCPAAASCCWPGQDYDRLIPRRTTTMPSVCRSRRVVKVRVRPRTQHHLRGLTKPSVRVCASSSVIDNPNVRTARRDPLDPPDRAPGVPARFKRTLQSHLGRLGRCDPLTSSRHLRFCLILFIGSGTSDDRAFQIRQAEERAMHVDRPGKLLFSHVNRRWMVERQPCFGQEGLCRAAVEDGVATWSSLPGSWVRDRPAYPQCDASSVDP